MSSTVEHPALERLKGLESRSRAGAPTMGYQPSLDGLRAMSVVAVILYHAGFTWMHGGFFGVEVFFVVSGYLITSLLLDEREGSGRVNLGQFWLRRARRLLPALFAMLVAVGVWAAIFGNEAQQYDLRRDYPWSIFYIANWGQIFGGAPYFGNLSPLRHLWSLAVEEQWYLVWPLVFVVLAGWRATNRRKGSAVLGVGAVAMVATWWMARATEITSDTANMLYLSTFTRSSGLLLGAGAAFLWRPWRSTRKAAPTAGHVLDFVGLAAVGITVAMFLADTSVTDRAVFRWQLPVVSIAALVAVLVAVHPSSTLMRSVFGSKPMVEIGKRSYGLYLWSWPISVFVKAYTGSWSRFIVAMLITVVVAEACYRFIETPIRHGALGRWMKATRTRDWQVTTLMGSVAAVVLLIPMLLFFSKVEQFDVAAGGEDVAFELPSATTPGPTNSAATPVPTDSSVVTATDVPVTSGAPTTSAAPPTTAAALPRSVAVVGDSQAHSLAINLPVGIQSTFTITNGAVEGCSVYDDGRVRSSRNGFNRSFADCGGWADEWAQAASGSDVALVVLGAWDVFDVEVDGQLIPFGTPAADQRFITNLQRGVTAMIGSGAHVALLEVPCMRPQDVEGAGVPALPERGDDTRIAHLNDLMRQVAAADPANVTFVEGPAAWCNDESISANLGYRWDGVHVYKPGAKLIYETIAPALLAIPIP